MKLEKQVYFLEGTPELSCLHSIIEGNYNPLIPTRQILIETKNINYQEQLKIQELPILYTNIRIGDKTVDFYELLEENTYTPSPCPPEPLNKQLKDGNGPHGKDKRKHLGRKSL